MCGNIRRRSFLIALPFCPWVVCPLFAGQDGPPPFPFVGRWKFNPAASDLSITRLVFNQAPSGDVTTTIRGLSHTFRIDGKERPGPPGLTAIWTRTGARMWQTVYRRANADNRIEYYALSEDGKTLTMRSESLLPTKSEQTVTFTRATGGPGLMGTWLAKTARRDPWVLELSAVDAKRVAMVWSFGGKAVLPIDGTESPVTGSPTEVPPEMTASLRVTGARSFDLALNVKAVNIASGHFTVSVDGKTMDMQSFSGPPGPAQERWKGSFDKQ